VALFAGFIAPYSYDRNGHDYVFPSAVWPRLQGFHLVVPRYEQSARRFSFITPLKTTPSRSIFLFTATNTNCSA
jgi:hypothetical protein